MPCLVILYFSRLCQVSVRFWRSRMCDTFMNHAMDQRMLCFWMVDCVDRPCSIHAGVIVLYHCSQDCEAFCNASAVNSVSAVKRSLHVTDRASVTQAQQDAAVARQREVHSRHLQSLQAQLATPGASPSPTAVVARNARRNAGRSGKGRLSFRWRDGSSEGEVTNRGGETTVGTRSANTDDGDATDGQDHTDHAVDHKNHTGCHESQPGGTDGTSSGDLVNRDGYNASGGDPLPNTPFGRQNAAGGAAGGMLTPGSTGGWPASNPLFESPGEMRLLLEKFASVNSMPTDHNHNAISTSA